MFKRIKKEWDGKYGWALKLGSAILLFSLGSCTFSDGVQDGLDNEPKTEETNQIIVGDKTFTEENLIRYVENLEKEVDQLRKAEKPMAVELTIEGEVKTFNEEELAEFVGGMIDENTNLQSELDKVQGELENTQEELKNKQSELEEVQKELEEQTITEAEEPEVQEESTENEIEPLTYEDLARNPEENTGKPVEFYGEVIQVVEGDMFSQYRFIIDGDYDQVILLEILNSQLDERILEGDLLTITGVSEGNLTYTTVLGASVTVPAILVTDYTLEN